MPQSRIPRINFPDEVWGRMKAWAKIQAQAPAVPSIDECAAYVRFCTEEITGRADILPAEVVNFYAAETLDMIDRLREDAALNT
jgi:hypothetical protein